MIATNDIRQRNILGFVEISFSRQICQSFLAHRIRL